MEKYSVVPCACRSTLCPDWHVYPIAAVQGVHFTKPQAVAIARLLNQMETESDAAEE